MNNSTLMKNNFLLSWGLVIVGFIVLYYPTYSSLATGIWATEEQGHGPLILMISAFLLWQKKEALFDKNLNGSTRFFGGFFLLIGMLFYIVGRSQDILILEVSSQIFVLMAFITMLSGFSALKKLWFPLFFLIFMLPLPVSIVDAITLPMKIAVSNVVEMILYQFDYPIARNGVILQIGYYKLLVADACAGLHTVFTLEAMGLLYLHLIKRDSFIRNVSLAVLIIPISFFANSVRVIILVLVTYYYGDEVGQGFIHGFAGFVLFGTALVIIIGVDSTIHWAEKRFSTNNKGAESDKTN